MNGHTEGCLNPQLLNSVFPASDPTGSNEQALQPTLFEFANETNETLASAFSSANDILDRLGATHHVEQGEFPCDSYLEKVACIKELANRLNTAICQIASAIG